MRVLIAMDGSKFSQSALDSVKRRTWPDGSEFLLYSVVEPLIPEIGGWVSTDLIQEQTDILEAQTKEFRLLMPQHKITFEVSKGNASDEIVKTADEWDADFIVMGSHGRRGMDHFVLGSVAESVVNKSNCSVEVIKARQKKN
ncbi:MAG: universal stress protein [Candidatus Obscuribacterales bacterium]|nr:universal stress protein [Candidatus Obscuribacterales bacterium]